MLKIRYKNLQKDPFWIMERNYSIGSADDNHLTLDLPSISEHHVKFVRETEAIILKDLGSANGTFVNGHRINHKAVCCGDQILVGNIELEIIDPLEEIDAMQGRYWSLIGDSSWLAGQEFPLIFNQNTELKLGRGKHCDIVFPGTHLSREHASLQLSKGRVLLKDLKSANATFVNDERIDIAEITPGDRIRLDVYSFKVFGPGIQLHKAATRRIQAVNENRIAEHCENLQTVKPADRVNNQSPTDKPKPTPKSRRWKTRPTSPGNRDEQQASTSTITKWLLALLLATIIASITLRVLLGSFI